MLFDCCVCYFHIIFPSLITFSLLFYIYVSPFPLECLSYHSKETIENGLNVIVDTQLCSWRNARNAIQYVNDLLYNKNAKLYAVRSDIFLDNCTKSQKYLNVSDFKCSSFSNWIFEISNVVLLNIFLFNFQFFFSLEF